MADKKIDLQKRIRTQCHNLCTMYKDSGTQQKLRLILYGEKGSAKTTTAMTARKPIFVDSFDPGGMTVKRIEKDIQKGDIIPDTRWERKSLKDDHDTIQKWFSEMKMREADGLFDNIGTYVLDGGTLFAEFLMRSVIQLDEKNKTRLTEAPIAQLQNYYPFQQRILNVMKGFSDLPCDVIVTFHATKIKNMVDGTMFTSVAIPGEKAPEIVTSVFGELWMTTIKPIAGGSEFKLLTRRDGIYKAVTRIGDGKLDQKEPPNICNMLKKCGWDTTPKPNLFEI